MGMLFSQVWTRLIGTREKRILMLGLDATGKTTIKLAAVVTIIPTAGFFVEYKTIRFNVREDKICRLWRYYLQGTDGLTYVVDSSDRGRIHDGKEGLDKMFHEQVMENAVLLIPANTQELLNAITAADVMEKLELRKLRHLKWFVQPTVALKVKEAFRLAIVNGDRTGVGILWKCRCLLDLLFQLMLLTSPWATPPLLRPNVQR
eukprot:Skav212156  [mRNA]  locus=scaffold754:152090:152701:+ [translate_table: standard]